MFSHRLSSQNSWITNSDESGDYTVLAVTDPDGRRGRQRHRIRGRARRRRIGFGALEGKMGIKGSPTRKLHFDNVRIPG